MRARVNTCDGSVHEALLTIGLASSLVHTVYRGSLRLAGRAIPRVEPLPEDEGECEGEGVRVRVRVSLTASGWYRRESKFAMRKWRPELEQCRA